MKKGSLLLLLAVAIGVSAKGNTNPANTDIVPPTDIPVDADTSRVTNLETAIVVASPKETSLLRRQALSVSLISKDDLDNRGSNSLKEAATLSANFYMPQYGSRLTSAAYIRGIGSRINTPAVGLYVDNMPFLDKTAYDFNFIDVDRIDVLRGPQSTLYGRNTMGGLIKIHTADPFTHHGTDIALGATSRSGGKKAQFNTFFHNKDNTLAASVGAFYEGQRGFFRNVTTGGKADKSNAAGAKSRVAWQANPNLRFDVNLSYEYSDERACPYFLLSDTITHNPTDVIPQNRQSLYQRNLFNAGIGITWEAPKFILSSITAYQHLKDRLFMDQDFCAIDLFSLEQRQRLNNISEEISIKSKPGKQWQWTTGIFANHQWLNTTCPVTFYGDGVDYLNNQFTRIFSNPAMPPMRLAFNEADLPFYAKFRTPSMNAAIFHQSTLHDLFVKGLSLTVGLRLDYDRHELNLNSMTTRNIYYAFAMPSFRINAVMSSNPAIAGDIDNDTWLLLPKFALQYEFGKSRNNVYALVSRGYRSGGYNIQNYSDLSQTLLRRQMMINVQDYVTRTINAMPLPDASKERAIAGMTGAMAANIPEEPAIDQLHYDAETSWNYEVGTHLNLFGQALQLDASLFMIETRNQQLARFTESGFGRILVNAGKSRSCGGEVSLRAAMLSNRLFLTAGYGYTHAVFTNYDLGTSNGIKIDYTDNRVPFAPEHTVNAALDFRQPVSTTWLKAVSAGVDVFGAGNVYWNEANTMREPFYAVMGARIGMEFAGNISVSIWGKNLTGNDYRTFQFVNMNRTFAQYGTPRHFGIDLNVHF